MTYRVVSECSELSIELSIGCTRLVFEDLTIPHGPAGMGSSSLEED